MLKKYIWLMLAAVFFTLQMLVGSVEAAELDTATRTVPLDDSGKTVVLSVQQIKEGKRLFNYACGICHLNGGTKTDPNLDLSPETLSLATPPRKNIAALVDYLKNPTTYDGETSIAELHPSLQSQDIFPKMRNLSEDQLVDIAGHILIQPRVNGQRWAGGKIYF